MQTHPLRLLPLRIGPAGLHGRLLEYDRVLPSVDLLGQLSALHHDGLGRLRLQRLGLLVLILGALLLLGKAQRKGLAEEATGAALAVQRAGQLQARVLLGRNGNGHEVVLGHEGARKVAELAAAHAIPPITLQVEAHHGRSLPQADLAIT
eukprot:scaffold5558_cov241-Pinguiococcus_pyrenoidosus.AAC.1